MNYYSGVNGQQFLSTGCKGIVHRVKRGDSLYKLSKLYGVSVSAIMSANRNMNVYNLQVGDRICIPVIPGPGGGNSGGGNNNSGNGNNNNGGNNSGGNVINGFMYRVTPNDTLNSILEMFNITFEEFARYNPQLMPITLEENTTVYLPPDNIAR